MLVIVTILLIFGLIVRHKWKNATAKKEEILRILAVASEEEAVIAKLQAVEEFHPPSPQPPLLEKQYYCAVCYSHATTRCSKCKAVRYCSGKCQIIHWRQGHRDDCHPATSLHTSKKTDSVGGPASGHHLDMHLNDEAKSFSDPRKEQDSGSSSNSLPSFFSSTDRSETSFDDSINEVLESGTPMKPGKAPSVGDDLHFWQPSSDSDDADVHSSSTLDCTAYSTNKKLGPNKIKKTLACTTDEVFEPSSSEDKRNYDGAAMLEDSRLSKPEFRIHQSSSSVRTSAAEDRKNQAPSSSGREMRSTSITGSGNHQMSNVDLRSSQCSKSLKMPPSNEYWENEAQLSNGKETRSMSFRTSGNNRNASTKNESSHVSPSEVEAVQMFSQPTSKGLKTSVRKFVQQFRSPKQSKSGVIDTGKDSSENYNLKVIFPLKLFVQLYFCDGVAVQPFGLANCGNSCYANAVLQCLTFTRPITSYLLQGLHTKTCRKRDWCFTCEFEILIRKGQETSFALSPVKIISQIPVIGSHLSRGREEDAHEFLRNVVDIMQSICLEEAGVSGSPAEDSTLVGLTFGGYLQSKIKCMKCLGRSERCDRMMDLTVEIDGNVHTLEEALAQFTTSEILGGDDKYKCSRCKSYEKAKKQLTVLEAPNILTISLKRFQSVNLEKLNKLVQFPEFLNLAPYMSGMNDEYPLYHLYAVVVHSGIMNGAYNGGHYVSYVKDFQEIWFKIDDSRVSPVDLETVLSVEAYILFYARHTPRVGSMMNNNSNGYSDVKTKRNMEAISSSNSFKKKNAKSKPMFFGQSTESVMLHQRSDKHNYWTSPNDFTRNHIVQPDGWGSQSKYRNPVLDSSSDSSSIFSVSDAGSYSTDSTKDSNADEISGYIFGSSNWYQP